MPDYSAGSASIKIGPDLSGFITKLREELRRADVEDVNIHVEPDFDGFEAEVLSRLGAIQAGLSPLKVKVEADFTGFEESVAAHTRDRTMRVRVVEDRVGGSRAGGGSSSSSSRGGGIGRFGTAALGAAAFGEPIVFLGATAAAEATTAIGDLTGALALLPAAFGAAAAGAGVAKLAFEGFSDALSGDAKAGAAAMAEMPASMQDVVTALRDQRPAWDALRSSVQDSFWSGQAEGIRTLAERSLPMLDAQLSNVGSSMGGLMSEAVGFLSEGGSQQSVATLLANTSGLFTQLQGAVRPVMDSILQAAEAGSGHFARLGAAITDVSNRFNNWVGAQADNGNFDRWIDNAMDGFADLGRIVGGVGSTIASVMNAATAARGGETWLERMADGAERLGDWASSFTGQNSLQSFFRDARAEWEQWQPFISDLGSIFMTAAEGVRQFGQIVGSVLRPVTSLLAENEGAVKALVTAYLAMRTFSMVRNFAELSGLASRWNAARAAVIGYTQAAGAAAAAGSAAAAAGSAQARAAALGGGLRQPGSPGFIGAVAPGGASSPVNRPASLASRLGAGSMALVGGPWGAAALAVGGTGLAMYNTRQETLAGDQAQVNARLTAAEMRRSNLQMFADNRAALNENAARQNLIDQIQVDKAAQADIAANRNRTGGFGGWWDGTTDVFAANWRDFFNGGGEGAGSDVDYDGGLFWHTQEYRNRDERARKAASVRDGLAALGMSDEELARSVGAPDSDFRKTLSSLRRNDKLTSEQQDAVADYLRGLRADSQSFTPEDPYADIFSDALKAPSDQVPGTVSELATTMEFERQKRLVRDPGVNAQIQQTEFEGAKEQASADLGNLGADAITTAPDGSTTFNAATQSGLQLLNITDQLAPAYQEAAAAAAVLAARTGGDVGAAVQGVRAQLVTLLEPLAGSRDAAEQLANSLGFTVELDTSAAQAKLSQLLIEDDTKNIKAILETGEYLSAVGNLTATDVKEIVAQLHTLAVEGKLELLTADDQKRIMAILDDTVASGAVRELTAGDRKVIEAVLNSMAAQGEIQTLTVDDVKNIEAILGADAARRIIAELQARGTKIIDVVVNNPNGTITTSNAQYPGGITTTPDGGGLAAGGPVRGPGGPKDDAVLMWGSNGEFMQQADAVDYYGVGFMSALNDRRIPREALPGFAEGGLVSDDLATRIKAQFPDAIITDQGIRNWDDGTGGSSYHYQGQAIDIAGPNMQGYYDWIAANYPNSSELLNEGNHIHWAMGEGAGSPAGGADAATAGAATTAGASGSGSGGSGGGGGGGGFDFMKSFIEPQLADVFQVFGFSGLPHWWDDVTGAAGGGGGGGGGGGSSSGGGGASTGATSTTGSANGGGSGVGPATSRGWGSGPEQDALQELMFRESGGDPTAQNPTSTAYGRWQFLDSTWATVGGTKTSDPDLQDEYGMRYIASKYGTPTAALQHHDEFGWYHDGGWIRGKGDVPIVAEGEEFMVKRDAARASSRILEGVNAGRITDADIRGGDGASLRGGIGQQNNFYSRGYDPHEVTRQQASQMGLARMRNSRLAGV